MRPSDAVIILQARLGSSRLPGKALKPLAGATILARCLERLLASGAAPIVLATTEREEDDALDAEAASLGVPCLRGADADVLGRFAQVVAMLTPAYVIRATADNPAVDIDAPERVLAHLRRGGVDYVVEQGLPVGAAVEGMRADALLRAAADAVEPYDREHVTPYLKRPEQRFRVLVPQAPSHLRAPSMRLTVDTPEDLAFMDTVLRQAGGSATRVPLSGIMRAAWRVSGRQEVA
jgi:spore coat polysaccharide biosynthesis protein SpsF